MNGQTPFGATGSSASIERACLGLPEAHRPRRLT